MEAAATKHSSLTICSAKNHAGGLIGGLINVPPEAGLVAAAATVV